MHPRLRQFLHDRNVAVGKFARTVEARRVKILEAHRVDVIFDLGANAGDYAALLRGAGYRGRILSFEPVGEVFDRLADRAERDPSWEVHKIAVGAEPGQLDMNVTSHLSYSSALAPREEYVLTLDGEAEPIRVEAVAVDTLDHLAELHAATPEMTTCWR